MDTQTDSYEKATDVSAPQHNNAPLWIAGCLIVGCLGAIVPVLLLAGFGQMFTNRIEAATGTQVADKVLATQSAAPLFQDYQAVATALAEHIYVPPTSTLRPTATPSPTRTAIPTAPQVPVEAGPPEGWIALDRSFRPGSVWAEGEQTSGPFFDSSGLNHQVIADLSIANGEYTWDVTAPSGGGGTFSIPAGQTTYGDVYVSVDVDRLSEPRLAMTPRLIFRWASGNFYTLSVSEGNYQFNRFSNNTLYDTVLTGGVPDYHEDGNKMSVRSEGAHMWLFVNDQLIGEYEDKEITSGRLGLGILVTAPKYGIKYVFRNFEVYSPPQ